MKLQSASKKEILRIALGTLAGDILLAAGLVLLDLIGLWTVDPAKALLSGAIGSAVAVLNFVLLCLTVQYAAGITAPGKRDAGFRLSYNARMLLQAGWVLTAFLAEPIDFIAGAAPLFFPRATIVFLGVRQK